MKIDLLFWLILAFSASATANLLAFLYVRQLLGRLLSVGENLGDLVELINVYKAHLKSVYEMEMFYGDQTLKFLLKHTTDLVDLLEDDYGDVYAIVQSVEEPEELTEETKEDAEKTINKENVFYAGARTSNN